MSEPECITQDCARPSTRVSVRCFPCDLLMAGLVDQSIAAEQDLVEEDRRRRGEGAGEATDQVTDPIWTVMKTLERELFEGVPPHVLGRLPDLRWSVMLVNGVPRQAWYGTGIGIAFSVPILFGEVPCVEGLLEMDDRGAHVKNITSCVEGRDEPRRHATIGDLISYCRELRKLAATSGWSEDSGF